MTRLSTKIAGGAGSPEPATATSAEHRPDCEGEDGLDERVDEQEEEDGDLGDEDLGDEGLDDDAAPASAGNAPDRVVSGRKRPAAMSAITAAKLRSGPASESLE